MAEAEAVLSFDIFWFNLLIWSQSFGVRVEARRNYGWNYELYEVNEFEMTIKTKKTTTQDQVTLNIVSFLLGQSDPLGY